MELQELLALYDREERIKAEWPGMLREETDLVVRHRPKDQAATAIDVFIAHTRLDADNADRVIARADRVRPRAGVEGRLEALQPRPAG